MKTKLLRWFIRLLVNNPQLYDIKPVAGVLVIRLMHQQSELERKRMAKMIESCRGGLVREILVLEDGADAKFI